MRGKCVQSGCHKRPSFGEEGSPAAFCAAHKQSGMVNVNAKRCSRSGCFKRPSFGVEGSPAAFCAEHKQSGMVDVHSKRCGRSGCFKSPNFGVEGSPAAFCTEHKNSGMVDVRSKRCGRSGCLKSPNFGVEGSPAAFCAEHKQSGMVNVNAKRCSRSGCFKIPNFGVEGSPAAFCTEHKQSGMMNVSAKRCGRSGCFKSPSFGVEGSPAAFCTKHKKSGMVNVRYRPSTAGKRKRVAREEDDCGSDSDFTKGDNDSEPQQHRSVSAERALRFVYSSSAVSHNPSSKRNQTYLTQTLAFPVPFQHSRTTPSQHRRTPWRQLLVPHSRRRLLPLLPLLLPLLRGRAVMTVTPWPMVTIYCLALLRLRRLLVLRLRFQRLLM
ncbi:unnamed protein product [Ectocarpus sp. 4 AP-2014]|uniref:EsV-1-7 n=1 Tax=Ectocarpus siliculosus virus 1 (isolate New Zealand/Kaikoura/1988) TaxID=654926 RepID=Q8QNQ2_ESV1K|nr:EsV-1-7 [Ectocarpus siliculosus virus 1]AAK14433.1 EsV-1-7 [Ectocarpus siliculosus virus 1]